MQLALTLLTVSGCASTTNRGSDPELSVSGVIAVTGTALDPELVLLREGTQTRLTSDSSEKASLKRVAGTEVVLHGRLTTNPVFHVDSFLVLRVDGVAVVDGFLQPDGEHLAIVRAKSRQRVANPPEEFRKLIAARIWIAGALDRGPYTYGLITPPIR